MDAAGLFDSSTLRVDAPASGPKSAPHAPGTRLGRYIVIDELGEGGMGRVYRAYDPKLGREVALKQMTPGTDARSRENAMRMLREAQAMAKLAHPNVVPVYDVEGDGAELVIAMEFVDGFTLATWLLEGDHPLPELIRVFREAGRGLAVAHQAGLTHRDFKPGNVMLGADGRARVMDFGLARLDPAAAPNPSLPPEVSKKLSKVNALTCASTVMGTPQYMAPEQHESAEDVGPAADQYAFCVTLWQALYLELPFRAANIPALAEAKRAGPPRAPTGRDVPQWLHRVVARGLLVDPTARWPTMQALVDALDQDPAAHRRRRLAIAGGVLGISAIATFFVAAPAPCEGAGEQLADAWNDEARDAMTSAMESTGLSYAPRTAELATRQLDAFASAWVESHADACRATHVRHEQSPEVLDRRIVCLDRAKTELNAVVELLSTEVDQRTLERTQRVVGGLPSLQRCNDVEVLLAEVPPPEDPKVAAQVEVIEGHLASAAARGRSGRAKEVLETFDPLLDEAEATGYLPLLANAHIIHARLLQRAGSFESATEAMVKAYVAAVEAGDDTQAARAAVDLAFYVGDRMGQTERGHLWLDIGGALARRLDSGGELEAIYFNSLGNVLKSEGRLEEAIDAYDRAGELFAANREDTSTRVATVLSNSAIALNELQRPKEALPRLERALALNETAFGEDHPRLASTATNLGLTLHALHRYDEAAAHHVRAREIFAASVGTEHPNYAAALTNIAMSFVEQGRLDEAEPLLVQSLEIKEAALGLDHRGLVPQLVNLGILALKQEKHREGLAHTQRAHDILVALHGESHHLVAMTKASLGSLYAGLGEYDEGRSQLDAALAYYEKTDGPEAPSLGMPLTARGDIELNAGDGSAAQPWFERSLAVQVKNGAPAPELALAKFGLARTLSLQGVRLEESEHLAKEAFEVFRKHGDELHAGEVRAWLISHFPLSVQLPTHR